MPIHSPYNFVPLGNWSFIPQWSRPVSHDLPFQDGISGTLVLSLTNTTPLLVGGEVEISAGNTPRKVFPYKLPDEKYGIQGNSLKGMIRAVLEIASFGRFGRVSNRRYSVRDLTEANNFYLSAIKESQPGWLRYKDGQWFIKPCSEVRVTQKAIQENFNISEERWKSVKTARERYALLDGIQSVKFSIGAHKTKGKIANTLGSGKECGDLIMTGQPGPFYFDKDEKKRKSAKKWEFIFYDNKQSSQEWKPVDPEVIEDFMFIHKDSKDWDYWHEKKTHLSDKGIPIFSISRTGRDFAAIGLSKMFRLAYQDSIHETIERTDPRHLDSTLQDLSETLFGFLSDSQEQESLRSRVSFSPARCEHHNGVKQLARTILATPNPTYYPCYLQQETDNFGKLESTHYSTQMDPSARVNGWKRYQAKSDVGFRPLTADEASNDNLPVILNPLDSGAEFSFTVRLHNVLPVELGALLWCVTWGKDTRCVHQLGMGKPLGLGQVKLAVEEHQLYRSDGWQRLEDNDLDACMFAFTEMMEAAYRQQQTRERPIHWINSPQLKALRKMAQPNTDRDPSLHYMELQDFAGAKKNQWALRKVDHSVGPADSCWKNEWEQAVSLEPWEQVLETWRRTEAEKQNRQLEMGIFGENAPEVECLCEEVDTFVAGKDTKTFKKNMEKNAIKLCKKAKVDNWTLEAKQQLVKICSPLRNDFPKVAKILDKLLDIQS